MRSSWTMLKLRTGLALGALGLSLGTLAGCPVTNLEHCALNQGACGEGLACSMCAVDNNGCVPQGALVEDACVFASGTSDPTHSTSGQTTTSDPTTVTPTGGSDTSENTFNPTTLPVTTTTGDTSTTGDTTDESTVTTESTMCMDDVVANPACGGEAPYCVDGTCVGCGELDCSVVEPTKPTCAADLGLCVECQAHNDCATLEKPACNLATATCMPCNSHDQCPATACNLETGQCFPKETVLYVDNSPDIVCSDGKDDAGFSPGDPICTLQNAISRLTEGVEWTVKIKTGTKAQNGPTELPPGDFTVAIMHYGNTVPSLILMFADPALTVNEGNTVFMNRVGIYNPLAASDPLVACVGGATGARLWFERQRIFTGKTAIRANNCRVHVRRSTITNNAIGAIDIDGLDPNLAKLWIENSNVTDNNGIKFGAIRVGEKVDVSILYSTIALNKGPPMVAPIECLNNWDAKMTIRNSALVNSGPLFGGGCAAMDLPDSDVNLLLPGSGDKGTLGNVFSGFSDGVYQAKIGGALKDRAIWYTGDPAVDYDENLRPTNDGDRDYAGADRPEL